MTNRHKTPIDFCIYRIEQQWVDTSVSFAVAGGFLLFTTELTAWLVGSCLLGLLCALFAAFAIEKGKWGCTPVWQDQDMLSVLISLFGVLMLTGATIVTSALGLGVAPFIRVLFMAFTFYLLLRLGRIVTRSIKSPLTPGGGSAYV